MGTLKTSLEQAALKVIGGAQVQAGLYKAGSGAGLIKHDIDGMGGDNMFGIDSPKDRPNPPIL